MSEGENTYKHFFSETTSNFITKLCMGSYCGLLYKIVVSIGNDLAKDPASPELLGI
jgi:hypothetical protein